VILFLSLFPLLCYFRSCYIERCDIDFVVVIVFDNVRFIVNGWVDDCIGACIVVVVVAVGLGGDGG